jgi:mRNA degradation ribonuclease J1/J2
VLDSLALAIETPAGVVLASGDFKIDAQAPPDERTDL